MSSQAKLTVRGNIVHAETRAGMDISKADVDRLFEIVNERALGEFGLIEIRPKEVSIDPASYRYAKELMPQLRVFALVAESELTFKVFESETAFMRDLRFGIFKTLAEAESWMKSELESELP